MKANELMIGDWVDRFNYLPYYKVIAVDNTTTEVTISQTGNNDDTKRICWDDKLDSIPLTSEILEKNGFLANKHVYPYPYYEYINEENKLKIGFAFPQGNRTSYKEPWVYIDSEYVFIEHLPCIFVHQLQHALRLCKITKEIEL